MKYLRPLLDRFASPLLMGVVVGIVVIGYETVDRLGDALAADHARINDIGYVLVQQNKQAEHERKVMEAGMAKHQVWVERRWAELNERLDRIETKLPESAP